MLAIQKNIVSLHRQTKTKNDEVIANNSKNQWQTCLKMGSSIRFSFLEQCDLIFPEFESAQKSENAVLICRYVYLFIYSFFVG